MARVGENEVDDRVSTDRVIQRNRYGERQVVAEVANRGRAVACERPRHARYGVGGQLVPARERRYPRDECRERRPDSLHRRTLKHGSSSVTKGTAS